MSIVRELIEYIEEIESKVDGGYGFNDGFGDACASIKMKVYEHLTDYQKQILKELSEESYEKMKDLSDVWGDELTQSLELYDLGLCKSDKPNIVTISDKGRKLIDNLKTTK